MAHQSKADRRARAKELAEARAKRSPSEQLAVLDARLGIGVGAFRERERLERACSEAEKAAEAKKQGA